MLKPGDIAYLPFTLQTIAGVAAVYADKTALLLAGWTLTYWNQGAVVASPTWALVLVNSAAGRYQVALTIDAAGQGECFLTPPAGYTSSAETHTLDVESYDLDALAALFLSASGTPGAQSAVDGDLGDVVDGDSWNSGTITISEAAMSPLGVTTLAGLTLEASFKNQPSDTAVTGTVTVIDAAARQLQVSWDTFPAAMALTGDDREKIWYLDVQLIRPAATGFATKRIKTPIRYQVRVVWQREVRTT